MKKIKIKTMIEGLIALAIPFIYLFLLGAFDGTGKNTPQSNDHPKTNIDFVNRIIKVELKIPAEFSPLKNSLPDSGTISRLINSQSIVVNIGKEKETQGNFYFRSVSGYEERSETGMNVLYLSSGKFVDGREKLVKTYIAHHISHQRPVLKADTVGIPGWFIKPKMKIRTADFCPGDIRPVAAILICNSQGETVDSTVIKVRNFSGMDGKYNGEYKEKFMTESAPPGENLMIPPGMLFDKKGNAGFDVKIYWFGEVDMWFEKITIDDGLANSLFEGVYDHSIYEVATADNFLSIVSIIKDISYCPASCMSINYVMNRMFEKLQSQIDPISLQTL